MTDETKRLEADLEDEAVTAKENSETIQGTESSDSLAELEQLREQLKAKEEEARENYDRFVRQVAELENFKKRANRDKEDAIRFGNEDLIKDLLPVIDNLERAVAHAQDGGNGKPLVDGVEMVLKNVFDILSKHGVVQISAIGQPFDPRKHEAIAQIESEGHSPNSVIEEHHKGYLLYDRLLRPALVSVAKAPLKAERKNGETEVEKEPADD